MNFIYLCQNGLYFVASTQSNVSASFVAEVISRVARVFKDYCGVLTEEAIRQNFVMVYELIDEMIVSLWQHNYSSEV